MARPAVLLSTKFSLPALEVDEDVDRKVRIRVVADPNGRDSTFTLDGIGFGLHSARVRFNVDRAGHFDEVVTFSWDGDEFSQRLPFRPLAAIAVVDGSGDEIRF